MLAKNQRNRNKSDNKAKFNNKNIDFMLFIQNDINGHIEWEQSEKSQKQLKIRLLSLLKLATGTNLGKDSKKNKSNNSSKWLYK